MAGQMQQVIIPGRISIEAAEVPDFITAEEVAAAGRRRVEDVLVVLEHNRAELEKRLGTKSNALAPKVDVTASKLTFEPEEPNFTVVFEAQAKDGEYFNRSEWQKQLPQLVSSAFSDFIKETATSVGHWQVEVSTNLVAQTGNASETKGRNSSHAQFNLNHGLALVAGLVIAMGALALLLML